jgi:hypothetical protein
MARNRAYELAAPSPSVHLPRRCSLNNNRYEDNTRAELSKAESSDTRSQMHAIAIPRY